MKFMFFFFFFWGGGGGGLRKFVTLYLLELIVWFSALITKR